MHSTTSNKSVSVVIPTYNGQHLLQQYLPSVKKALNFSFSNYEIIVIDDGSSDNTMDFIRSTYPEVILIKNKINQGFSATINRGIEKSSKQLLLCLNNDMELPHNFFENQLSFFDKPDTFGVMSAIKDINKEYILESRKIPEICSYGIKIKDAPNTKNGEEPYTFYLCGGNGLYNAKKIKMLGGFSNLYKPFYFEDVDLSARAWSVGWKSYYCDAAECYHMHSATIKSLNNIEFIETTSYLNFLKFSYFFLPEKLKKRFIVSSYLRVFYFSIAALLNTSKKNRVKAMVLLIKNRNVISKMESDFLDLCRTNRLTRKPINEVISNYFSSLPNKHLA